MASYVCKFQVRIQCSQTSHTSDASDNCRPVPRRTPANTRSRLVYGEAIMNGYHHSTSYTSSPRTKTENKIDQEALLQTWQEMVHRERMSSIEKAIKDLEEGKMIIVVDDENRENEGDLICAGELVTQEAMAFILRHTTGIICVSMESDRLEELKIPMMVVHNEDAKGTAFTVSVDSSEGISTGVSAADRALTIRKLGSPSSGASDFRRPGHVFPLKAREGGVLSRRGHTEAALDLCKMAGRGHAAVLCEMMHDNGEMMRLPSLLEFAEKYDMALITIEDLVEYRKEQTEISQFS